MFKLPTQWRQVYYTKQYHQALLSGVFLLLITQFAIFLGVSEEGVVGLLFTACMAILPTMALLAFLYYTGDVSEFSNQEDECETQELSTKSSQRRLVADGGQPKDIDAIKILLEAGVSTRRFDNEITLNDDFEDTWCKITSAAKGTDKAQTILRELLDIEADRTTFKDHGATYELRIDGLFYGNWESEAAFRVDMAAAYLFDDKYDRWDELSLWEQGEVLKVLRQLLETCPDCDNPLTVVQREKDSPYDPHGVMEMACDHCATQLYASSHSPGSISE